MPPSLRDWLADDHLAWYILDVVDELDPTALRAQHRDDGRGRAAFDPAMMVALLLYAYAIGERSSRMIERRCQEDVAFRMTAANQAPDHATIARFRVRHEAALGELFSQVVGICARAVLVRVGVIAVDGPKIAGPASREANRTYEQIVREILEEAAVVDAAEDTLLGDERGDELPPELADRDSRRARLRAAKARLEGEVAEAQAAHAAHLEARERLEAERGEKLRGRKPVAPAAMVDPQARANATVGCCERRAGSCRAITLRPSGPSRNLSSRLTSRPTRRARGCWSRWSPRLAQSWQPSVSRSPASGSRRRRLLERASDRAARRRRKSGAGQPRQQRETHPHRARETATG